MAIVLNDNIESRSPKSLDNRYLKSGATPYASTSEVNSTIPESYRYTGLTVNINGEEYWYKNGISNGDLILKSTFDSSNFDAYTAATEIRLVNIENDITGLTANFNTYTGITNASINEINADISYISGITNTKQNQLSAGGGISSTALSQNKVQLDLSNYRPTSSINITLSGGTHDFIITDNSTVKKGVEYGGNYHSSYTLRSLVDKEYVDNLLSGLSAKNSVKYATTAADSGITAVTAQILSIPTGIINGAYPLQNGDRVLVKDQSNKAENGIYVFVASASTLVRATDFNASGEINNGAFTTVLSGSNANTAWIMISPSVVTVGTDPVEWSQFALPVTGVADIVNIGSGAEIFSGISTNIAYIRTLSAGTGVNIIEHNDNIEFEVLLQSGTGVTVNTSGNTFILNASILGGDGINVTTSGSSVLVQALLQSGDGIDITQSGKTFVVNSLIAGGNNIQVTQSGNTYVISSENVNPLYTGETPTTITIGGLVAGSHITGLTANEILEEILIKYLEPEFESFAISGQSEVIEVGSPLSGTKLFTWSTVNNSNIVPNSIAIRYNNTNTLIATGITNTGSYSTSIGSLTNNTPTTFSWRIEGMEQNNPNGNNNFISNNYEIVSVYPYFYGKVSSGGAIAGANKPVIDNDFISGGTKVVQSSADIIHVSYNTTSDDYIWFAIPATSDDKLFWYIDDLNQGNIGGAESVGGNLFPDPIIFSATTLPFWTDVPYKVYISNYQTAINATMRISTSYATTTGGSSGGDIIASNGLSLNDGLLRLGGTLINSTIFTDARSEKVGLEYGGDYSFYFKKHSFVDVNYVTGITSQITGGTGGGVPIPLFNSYTGVTDSRLIYLESLTGNTGSGSTDISHLMPKSGGTFTGKVTFTPTTGESGINIGSLNGSPSLQSAGDLWTDSSNGRFMYRSTDNTDQVIARFNTTSVATNRIPIIGANTGRMFTETNFNFQNSAGVNTLSTPGLTVSTRAILPSATTVNNENIILESTFNAFSADTDNRLTILESASGFTGVTNVVTKTLFNTYTGDTENRLVYLESLTGSTSGVSVSTFNTYTGATDIRINALEAVIYKQKEISGTTYILDDDDNNSVLYFTNSALITVSGDTTALADNFICILAKGASDTGDITFIPINSTLDGSSDIIEGIWTSATITKRDSTTWYRFGTTITGDTGGSGVSTELFNTFTGDTDNRLTYLESITGSTSGVSISTFNSYTGVTDSRLTYLESLTGNTGSTDISHLMPKSGGTFTGKVTFTPTSENAGVNLGVYAGNPSSLVNGDIWLNSSTNRLSFYHTNNGTYNLLFAANTNLNTGRIMIGNGNYGLFTSSSNFTYLNNTLSAPVFSATTGMYINGNSVLTGITTSDLPSIEIESITASTYTVKESDRYKYLIFENSCNITIPTGLTFGWSTTIFNKTGTLNVSSNGSLEAVDNSLTVPNTSAVIVHIGGNVHHMLGALGTVSGGTGSGVSTELFNSFTADTDNRLIYLESITGSTSGVSVSTFNSFTGTTDTRLDTLEAEPIESTGSTVQFDVPRNYGMSVAITGNITLNSSGFKRGITQLMIHNNSSEPSFGSEFKIISGEYATNEDNYIFFHSVKSNLILVTINQEL